MAITYKQKCIRCKINYVAATYRQRYVVCHDCQEKEMKSEIKDPKMKKLFNIPEDFYKKNSFLKDIKLNYVRYENLTEKQISAFKKAVKEMKAKSK